VARIALGDISSLSAKTMTSQPTVYVVDDDPAARESVLALVKTKGVPAVGYSSAEEFLGAYAPDMIGALVLDVRMPGISGLELQQQLRSAGSPLCVMIITGYGDVRTAVRAMQSGAYTFLEKPCQDQELWATIQEALERGQKQSEQKVEQEELARRAATLTTSEREVLLRVLEGMPNKQIAQELDIGLRTVELRRSEIMSKFQANSLPELVRMAIRAGILPRL
jgi:two-component system response regulator FixJ